MNNRPFPDEAKRHGAMQLALMWMCACWATREPSVPGLPRPRTPLRFAECRSWSCHQQATCARVWPSPCMRARVPAAGRARGCRRCACGCGARRVTETGDVLHRAFHGARVVSCEMLSLPGFLTLHSNISADATPRTRIPTPRSETPGAAGASGQPQRRAGPRSRRHPICEELDDRGQLEALRYREGRLALAVLNLG